MQLQVLGGGSANPRQEIEKGPGIVPRGILGVDHLIGPDLRPTPHTIDLLNGIQSPVQIQKILRGFTYQGITKVIQVKHWFQIDLPIAGAGHLRQQPFPGPEGYIGKEPLSPRPIVVRSLPPMFIGSLGILLILGQPHRGQEIKAFPHEVVVLTAINNVQFSAVFDLGNR